MTTKPPKKPSTVNCYCDVAVKKGLVSKEGDNKGRVFLTCSLRQYDAATKTNYGGCTFFHFEDEPMRRCELCHHLKVKSKLGGDFCINCVNTYDTAAYLDAITEWPYLLDLLQAKDRKELRVYAIPGTTMISLINRPNEETSDCCKVAIQFEACGPIGKPTLISEANIIFASVWGKLVKEAMYHKLMPSNPY